MSYIYIYIYMEHPLLVFLDHTQRRSTVGRTPLDEWSARRRDLYLTTHDTHNRQMSIPPVGFEPKISAGERPCRSPAEILGSNLTGGMDICLLWVSCRLKWMFWRTELRYCLVSILKTKAACSAKTFYHLADYDVVTQTIIQIWFLNCELYDFVYSHLWKLYRSDGTTLKT